MPVPSWAQSGPILIGFLFVVVFFRAQGTYWLGRAVHAGAIGTKKTTGPAAAIARWFSGPVPRRGARLLDQWGIILIPLGFLTVGLQTAILAGAGMVNMKWRRFTLAMLPGALVWAFLYGFGMLAVWTAAVTAMAGNPWSWAALVTIIALIWGFTRWKSRQSGRFLSLDQVDGTTESAVTPPVSD